MKKKIVLGIMALLAIVCIFNACGNSKNNTDNKEKMDYVTHIFTGKELFTSQDLDGQVDGIDYTYDVSLFPNKDITISNEGIYKITGSASDLSVLVDVESDEEVQLVLDNLKLSNKSKPCINVVNANKVFITTTDSENTLEVLEDFDSSKNYDATIFSKKDIVFNGLGSLNIKSSKNAITSKDDVKITSGIYNIYSAETAIRADNSIRIADGIINLKSGLDGLHAENEYGDSLGYVYIKNGTISILSSDYGIRASSVMQINKGSIKTNSMNGICGTFVQINGGEVEVNAQENGIVSYEKSDSYKSSVEINGGNVAINMSGIDTYAIHSSGDIFLNDGEVNAIGSASIKYGGEGKVRSGNLTINGAKKNKI